jgi:hypothetical protein
VVALLALTPHQFPLIVACTQMQQVNPKQTCADCCSWAKITERFAAAVVSHIAEVWLHSCSIFWENCYR